MGGKPGLDRPFQLRDEMMRILALAGMLMGLSVGAAQAEKLTPERVFSGPDLSGPRARGVSLSPDGAMVTYLKAKTDDPRMTDLWAADVKGGTPRMLIDARALIPKDRELSEAEILEKLNQPFLKFKPQTQDIARVIFGNSENGN